MARNIPRRLNGDWRDYQKLSQLHLPAGKLHELEQLLNTAHAKYLQDLDTIAEDASAWARSLVEKHEAYMLEDDLRDYVDAAGAASTEYYDAVRQAWADAAGKQFPDFQHDRTASPEHTLWNVVGGTSHTDKPGYKFADMIAGKVPDMTIHSLFPDFTSADDAEQFAADMVRQAARDTMVMHQRRDPTKPRYARVPQGKVTCAFCLMLASRGFAYHSEESAGLFHTYHRHCDCQIVPCWGEQHLQGYDPEEMSSLYESAKHQTKSKDYREILKTLRRIAPSQLKDGVQPKQQPQRAPKTRTNWLEEINRGQKAPIAMAHELETTDTEWDKRQKALNIPLSEDILEAQEIVFAERFKKQGQQFKWIPKSEMGKATNDFIWVNNGNLPFELKSMGSTTYKSIVGRISTAANSAREKSNVVKENFIIDIGDKKLKESDMKKLANFNNRKREGEPIILKHLYIYSQDKLIRLI